MNHIKYIIKKATFSNSILSSKIIFRIAIFVPLSTLSIAASGMAPAPHATVQPTQQATQQSSTNQASDAPAASPLLPRSHFTIAPYLFSGIKHKLQLAWEFDPSFEPKAPTEVKLFQNKHPLATATSYRDHELHIVDLPLPLCGFEAGITYELEGLEGSEGNSAPIPITQIPCPGENSEAKFSFISDTQEFPKYLYEISHQILLFPGSLVLNAGDLVQTGSTHNDWVDYFTAMSSVMKTRVTVAAIGNHDYRGANDPHADSILWGRFLQTQAHEATYSFDIGPVHIMVLNSNFESDADLIESQIPWLKKELETKARWKVVMLHHPPYASSIFQMDLAPKKEHLRLREKYVPMFEAYGVDLVLAGHTHIFEHLAKDNVHYLVAGPAGGKMGISWGKNEYSLISSPQERTITHFEVNQNWLRAVSVAINGRVIDSFTLSKK